MCKVIFCFLRSIFDSYRCCLTIIIMACTGRNTHSWFYKECARTINKRTKFDGILHSYSTEHNSLATNTNICWNLKCQFNWDNKEQFCARFQHSPNPQLRLCSNIYVSAVNSAYFRELTGLVHKLDKIGSQRDFNSNYFTSTKRIFLTGF